MRAFPTSAALLAACLFALTGCSRGGNSPGTPEAGASATTTSPSTSSSTSSGSPAPTDTPSASVTPGSLTARLLATATVPGLTAGWQWQDGQTGPAGGTAFGVCAKVDLASIGATEVVERSYFPPVDSDDGAAEQIAQFPDANTAVRAWSVLTSWHDGCAQMKDANPGLLVRPLVPVTVPSGSADWYLLSWIPTGEETPRFEAFGLVLDGTRIAVMRMDNSTERYDYPAGHEPMVAMVTAAAATLG